MHYVWCSEDFEPAALGRYAAGAGVPPSSSPARIYADLKAAVQGGDKHCDKIVSQRSSYKARAAAWHAAGEITQAQLEEIVYFADEPDLAKWRPLLYVIPLAAVASRIQVVPAVKRAGLGPEYIIPDLAESEFDVIEP